MQISKISFLKINTFLKIMLICLLHWGHQLSFPLRDKSELLILIKG